MRRCPPELCCDEVLLLGAASLAVELLHEGAARLAHESDVPLLPGLCEEPLVWPGVYHRDVSIPNLMWYEKDGKLIGVLNDYDLYSLANEPRPRGNERTGTVPFMALELLTEQGQRGEIKHLYRHDLELFIWCFAWISLRYKEGVLRPQGPRPFDEWATSDAVACGNFKLASQTFRHVPDGTHGNGWQNSLFKINVVWSPKTLNRLAGHLVSCLVSQ
ncbi:hypothetical protein CY34DRAFT_805329 [Suillus luteus UH-Slu-Lm8-n1]|uniref:Fungal-type protein kinase domain-containing protein n=1 Tax=Suillus luteus UH-Slu-Lm8-n1 TaxID=930992 RepID=A0A0D0AW29_9AGAM|nr:hypothetical protein CY34DRAFT_805329 [Suillus luteus UH-Slu-Lm8-n1]